MKTFLFIILTILVHHTIQYESEEERKQLHRKNSPEGHEEDSYNFIKDLTNIKDYDSGYLQPNSEHYQNYYRELKDREIVRPLSGLRSASEIKNWMKDMIAMRGRRKKYKRPGHGHHPKPPSTTKKQKPIKTTKKPKPIKTTKEPNDSTHRHDVYISLSIEHPSENDNNTKEEQIILQYTPKHKKVDVPMIIFVPSRE